MSIPPDVRLAIRNFRKSPVFTTVAVLSLALGIGANTAIFSLLDQAILRLLPVKDPQQLVRLWSIGNHYGDNRGWAVLSYPMYKDFRDHNSVFTGMLCRYTTPLSVSFNGRTERAGGELVSGTYFPVLGVGTAIGRTITPEDDRVQHGQPVAVLSWRFWQRRFASDPAILNKTVVINGHDLTIVGVAQRGFDGVEPGLATDVWVPVTMQTEMMAGPDLMSDRRSRWVAVFGRLKPGVSMAQAQAGLQPFYHSMLEMEVREPAFKSASAETRTQFLKSKMTLISAARGFSDVQREMRRPLWFLMAMVGLVLLIACANVANLLLARATARNREVAIRLALGASRGRIMRQLLTESVLLAIAGGVFGVLLAGAADELLLRFVSNDAAHLTLSASPDLRVLLFNFAVALATGILFGLFPAVRATRPDVAPTLKDESGAVAGTHGGFRKALVVSQVALALLLLIGAGLSVRTLASLRSIDPGFPTSNLLSFRLDPSLNGYTNERSALFFRQLQAEMASIPGVRSSALAMIGILSGNEWDASVTVEGYRNREGAQPWCNAVGPAYFATMGIPLIAGREFRDSDTTLIKHLNLPFLIPNVVIVNEKFAKKFFRDGNALGRHIGFGGDPGTPTDMEIVGVVADSRYTGLRDENPPEVFIPWMGDPFLNDMTVWLRTSLPAEQVFSAVRQRVARLDPNIPIYNMRTMEQAVDQSLTSERLVATLAAFFGALATLLATIGLYGVMAYTVARRTREIGLRVALGAASGDVVWMVLREVVIMVAAGVAIALPAAWALSRLVSNLLYGVTPNDPISIAVAVALLAAVAIAAGWLPARRASQIDPMTALRYE
jgi:predicted permease